MAYDEELAHRLRECLQDEPSVTEKRMFGGLAFLINGNMAVSASGHGGLLLRVDPAATEALVAEPGAGRFQMRSQAMDGWLRIDSNAIDDDEELAKWVRYGVQYARSLPSE
jgi:TfoX/Sxy family transcriptional regulator of competence genes